MPKTVTRIDMTNRYFFGDYIEIGKSLDCVVVPAGTEVEITEYMTRDFAYVRFAGYPLFDHMIIYTADIEVVNDD